LGSNYVVFFRQIVYLRNVIVLFECVLDIFILSTIKLLRFDSLSIGSFICLSVILIDELKFTVD
jgi:hypothetical protein